MMCLCRACLTSLWTGVIFFVYVACCVCFASDAHPLRMRIRPECWLSQAVEPRPVVVWLRVCLLPSKFSRRRCLDQRIFIRVSLSHTRILLTRTALVIGCTGLM